MEKEIIYVGDPMCSWCYGFTNVIQDLRKQYRDQVEVSLVLGGFRPDDSHIVDAHYSSFLRDHWQEVSDRTGQPFDLSILENTGWIYNTEKPSRAVTVIRLLKPEVEWEYFAAVQKGFYHHNHNPNDPASFARIAEQFGIDPQTFLQIYAGEPAMEATQAGFRWARGVGVYSFPTVLLRDGERLSALTVGYRPLVLLAQAVDRWLAE